VDADLAGINGGPTKVLSQAARRNGDKFSLDCTFQLTAQEAKSLYFYKFKGVLFSRQGPVAIFSESLCDDLWAPARSSRGSSLPELDWQLVR